MSIALDEYIAQAKAIESLIPQPWWMGTPDRWFDASRWRCEGGHVSAAFLKSETRGDICLAHSCGNARVRLTFPEDTDRHD